MTITPNVKVSLSLRDWLAVVATLLSGAVVGAVYVERRVAATEYENTKQSESIRDVSSRLDQLTAAIEADRTRQRDQIRDLDRITMKLQTIIDERNPAK